MNEAGIAPPGKCDIVVMGASAGGVEALLSIFRRLPKDLPAAVAVVLHRHPLYNVYLLKSWGRGAALPLVEVLEAGPLNQGAIYIAPLDAHLILTKNGMKIG